MTFYNTPEDEIPDFPDTPASDPSPETSEIPIEIKHK